MFDSSCCVDHVVHETRIFSLEEDRKLIHDDLKHVKYLLGIVIAALLGQGLFP